MDKERQSYYGNRIMLYSLVAYVIFMIIYLFYSILAHPENFHTIFNQILRFAIFLLSFLGPVFITGLIFVVLSKRDEPEPKTQL